MAIREEITTLISYVLGEKNKQLLIKSGLEAVPKEARISALRGLQDLGWIGSSGLADYEESYSLTKEGRRIASERPGLTSLGESVREHVEALRAVDNETNCAQKQGLKKLIETNCDIGNWDSALIHCYHLRKLADKTKDTDMAAFALFNEGRVCMAQNRWDEALESYLNANEKFMEAGDTRGVAMTNRAMGVIYANKGDHASAIRCFESSLSMAKMIRDRDLEARAEGNLANVYDLEGRFDEAEKAYKRCLSFFVETGDLICSARTSNNLGVMNMLKEKYDAAAEHFERTIESCRRIKNKEVLGISLVNCGYCNARSGNLGKAVGYTDEAVTILKESNDMNLLALAYRNYGSIEMRSLKFEAACDWFEKSVRTARASGVEDTLAACYFEYGMSLVNAVTDIRFAKKLLKEAASIFRSIGNIDRARTIEAKLAAA